MGMFKEGSRAFLYTVIGVVALAVISAVAIYSFGGVSQLTAKFRGDTDEKNRTVADGAFRVASYERFYDLCSAVQAKESKIANIEKSLKDDDLSAIRREQLQEAVLANQNQRSEAIAEYNALTANKYRSAYLDRGLPADIDEENPSTECK